MAIDWIKMRVDLQSHPKVVRILSATKSDKFRVIGGLHAVWSVFDAHSEDGVLPGYTPETMDHIIGWEGLSAAMIGVGWLVFDGSETLVMPEFGEHNGTSAKRRAEDTKRKRKSRKCPNNVRTLSAEVEDSETTREEKSREEKKEQKKEQKKERGAKGSRLPPDWTPADDLREWTRQEVAGTTVAPGRELQKFRDHWAAQSGQKGVKLDWAATWRNWIRRAIDDAARKGRLSASERVKEANRQAGVADLLQLGDDNGGE